MSERETVSVRTHQLERKKIVGLTLTFAKQSFPLSIPSPAPEIDDFTFSLDFTDSPQAHLVGPNTGTLSVPEGGTLLLEVEAQDNSRACGHGQAYLAIASRRDYAILVGVDTVAATPTSLQYARDDAIAVTQHLIAHLNFLPSHIYLLLDDLSNNRLPIPDGVTLKTVKDPTDIDTAFAQINHQIDTSNAELVFYFSGHELVDLEEHAESPKYYLMLPVSRKDPGTAKGRFSWGDLVEDFHQSRVKRGVIIIDACYSGGPGMPLVNAPAAISVPARVHGKYIGSVYGGDVPSPQIPPEVWGWLFSSVGGPSWEFENLGHGLFTSALLKVGTRAAEAHTPLTLNNAYGVNVPGMVEDLVRSYVDIDPKDPQAVPFTPDQSPTGGFTVDAQRYLLWVK